MLKALFALLVTGFATIILAAVAQPQSAGKVEGDIVQNAASAGKFKTLLALVETAGLTDTLKGQGPFTLFAPTDDAFAKLPKETLERLHADKMLLSTVLKFHVVPSNIKSADILKFDSVTLKTVEGSPIALKGADAKVEINGASKINQVDVVCRNGIIHIIDNVLLPPALSKKNPLPGLTIAGYCRKAFVDDGGGYTVNLLGASGRAIVFADTDWEDISKRSAELVELTAAIAKLTPPKGTAESWQDRCANALEKANAIAKAAEKKDARLLQKSVIAYRTCAACHSSHR